MVVLGITGGTGTGKTTVSALFAEYGVYVIDADKVSRAVTAAGQPALFEIAEAFGTEIFNDDGTLARRRLGDIVFANPEKLNRLNQITHPYITAYIQSLLETYNGAFALIDGAVLIESGIYAMCDYLCVVLADREVRAERIMTRDDLTRMQAYARIEAQQKDDFYKQYADFVIWNNGDMDALRICVKNIIEKISN